MVKKSFSILWMMVLGMLLPVAGFAAEAVEHAAPEHAEHGLPLGAPVVFKPFGIPITDSMLVTWLVALGLILSAQIATRKMTDVPGKLQNIWEYVVESLSQFLASILGHDLAKKTFWLFASIFIFILTTNWVGLIPGVGTIGWGRPVEGHTHLLATVTTPLFRGGNADLNMTLAISVVFFILWIFWALQAQGPWGVIKHTFGPKGDSTGVMRWAMVVIFIAVGLLEVVSIAVRPISLSLRLFGNIYAGESILEVMSNMMRGGWSWLNYLLPVPFYFMEILVGLVQALVFMLLTAVFTLLICQHDEESSVAHH